MEVTVRERLLKFIYDEDNHTEGELGNSCIDVQTLVNFVNSDSDINYPNSEFEIGDSVEVPDPDDSDIHNHSFVGVIKSFRNGNAVVEDGDGDCFEIEVERLTLE